MSVAKYAQLLKKLPSPIYKVLAQNWIDYEWPRHLFIELTSNCNLSCPNCPRPRISQELPFGLLEKIVREASRYGHRSFSLHLFGEPLLYSRFADALGLIHETGHSAIVTTNGSYLGKHLGVLRKAEKIIWSYKEGIKVPEELKKWKNFVVRFFDNQREDKSWPQREVRPIHNYGGVIPLAKSTEITRYPCYHPFLAPAVNSRGEFLICCADPNGKSVVGNIRNMSVNEAWKKMDSIRKEHLSGQYKGICSKCNVWQSYPNIFFSSQYGT